MRQRLLVSLARFAGALHWVHLQRAGKVLIPDTCAIKYPLLDSSGIRHSGWWQGWTGAGTCFALMWRQSQSFRLQISDYGKFKQPSLSRKGTSFSSTTTWHVGGRPDFLAMSCRMSPIPSRKVAPEVGAKGLSVLARSLVDWDEACCSSVVLWWFCGLDMSWCVLMCLDVGFWMVLRCWLMVEQERVSFSTWTIKKREKKKTEEGKKEEQDIVVRECRGISVLISWRCFAQKKPWPKSAWAAHLFVLHFTCINLRKVPQEILVHGNFAPGAPEVFPQYYPYAIYMCIIYYMCVCCL